MNIPIPDVLPAKDSTLHSNAILHEVQQLYDVSYRLDLLAEQDSLISEKVVTISGSIRNTGRVLDILVARNMAPSSGLGDERHGIDKSLAAVAVAPEHKAIGYGLPCSNCHAYYPADMMTCPICKCAERVSPHAVPALPVVPPIITPDAGVVPSIAAVSSS
jgi:hypothetical protein